MNKMNLDKIDNTTEMKINVNDLICRRLFVLLKGVDLRYEE